MHIGLVTIKKKKLSKTEKNFTPIDQLLKEFHPDSIRYYLLTRNYRKPFEHSIEKLKKCETIIKKFHTLITVLEKNSSDTKIEQHTHYEQTITKSLANNFDTPTALATLHKYCNFIKKKKTQQQKEQIKKMIKTFKFLANLLGLLKKPIKK
jgi:cysteinyl-tRNA synthetase